MFHFQTVDKQENNTATLHEIRGPGNPVCTCALILFICLLFLLELFLLILFLKASDIFLQILFPSLWKSQWFEDILKWINTIIHFVSFLLKLFYLYCFCFQKYQVFFTEFFPICMESTVMWGHFKMDK